MGLVYSGRLTEDGKVISEHGYTQGNGTELHIYISTKGNFEWAENVVPHMRGLMAT